MAVAPTFVSNLPGAASSHVPGDLKEAFFTLTVGPADTYVTNGFAVTPAQFGLTSITDLDVRSFSTGHWGVYVPAGGLIKVFSAAATELANASAALQSATVTVKVTGK